MLPTTIENLDREIAIPTPLKGDVRNSVRVCFDEDDGVATTKATFFDFFELESFAKETSLCIGISNTPTERDPFDSVSFGSQPFRSS